MPAVAATATIARAMSEEDLLACVLDACRALGWKAAHFLATWARDRAKFTERVGARWHECQKCLKQCASEPA